MDATTTPERGLSQEPLITGEELVKIFNSRQFRNSLKELSEKLAKLDEPFEAGFVVLMDPKTKDFSILEERDMSINRIGLDQQGKEEFNRQLRKGKVPVIDFHFHPPTGDYHYIDSFTPSMSDLEELHQRGFKNKPLGVIGVMKGDGNIDMTFFQETTRYQLNSLVLRDQLDQDLFECRIVGEVLEILSEYGYKAGFGNYNLQKGLSDSLRSQIKAFSVSL